MNSKEQKNHPTNPNQGFTLIELLVVIAVLSLMLAILLPVLHMVRELSKRTICQGNLRNIALAWQTYFDDYDGKFLRGIDTDFLYGGWRSLHYQVKDRPFNKYVHLPKQPQTESEAKIFHCPSDLGDFGSDPFSTYSSRGTSYGTNILLIGQEQIGPLASNATEELKNLRREINAKLPNLHRNGVSDNSRLLLIGDMPGAMEWQLDYPHPEQHNWHGRQTKYNWAFIDGHVQFLRIQKGIFITSEYTVMPFKELYSLTKKAQESYQ